MEDEAVARIINRVTLCTSVAGVVSGTGACVLGVVSISMMGKRSVKCISYGGMVCGVVGAGAAVVSGITDAVRTYLEEKRNLQNPRRASLTNKMCFIAIKTLARVGVGLFTAYSFMKVYFAEVASTAASEAAADYMVNTARKAGEARARMESVILQFKEETVPSPSASEAIDVATKAAQDAMRADGLLRRFLITKESSVILEAEGVAGKTAFDVAMETKNSIYDRILRASKWAYKAFNDLIEMKVDKTSARNNYVTEEKAGREALVKAAKATAFPAVFAAGRYVSQGIHKIILQNIIDSVPLLNLYLVILDVQVAYRAWNNQIPRQRYIPVIENMA